MTTEEEQQNSSRQEQTEGSPSTSTVEETERTKPQEQAEKQQQNVNEEQSEEEEGEEKEGEEEERNSDKENQGKEKDSTNTSVAAQPHSWQAVWAPQQGAYYFWNAKTGETTWTNPLAPAVSAGAGPSTATSTAASTQAMSDEDFAVLHGIDPDLAFLDPSLYAARLASAKSHSSGSSAQAAYGASGAFDARTGKFVPTASVTSGLHDPSRLGQVARSTRQMEIFFDVNKYHAERAKEREDMTGDAKRQRLSKKELQAYKDKKKEKRLKKWKED